MKAQKRNQPSPAPDKGSKQLIKEMTKRFLGNDVKLRLLQNSGIMINGLEFTVMGESIGKESDKGFALSLSCDEIDRGRLTFNTVTLTAGSGTDKHVVTKKLELTKRSDGKYIYTAKFPNINIPQVQSRSKKEKLEELLAGSQNQFIFKLTPHYEGEKECEVMITLYPYENILTGAATLYKNVTSNTNFYADSLRKR